MKNQNDLIVIGVCAVLSIAAAVTMFFMKREPASLPDPQTVVTSTPAWPTGTDPVMGTSLPAGSGGGSGFGGGGGPAGIGGPGGAKGAFMGGGGGLSGVGKGDRPKMGSMNVGK